MLLLVTSIVFSLLCAAFFAASETAITGVSEGSIHKLVQQGSKRAKKVEDLRRDKERLISTLMLGNSALHIFASALATKACTDMFGAEGVAIATAIMTVSIVIFAEVLPKSYAFENPDSVAMKVAPLLGTIVRILYPLSTAIHFLVDKTMRLFGLNTDTEKKIIMSAIDQLRGAIDLHHHRGVVVKQDRDMLGGVLDLGQVEVAQVMIHRRQVDMVSIDQPLPDIIDFVVKSNYTRIPVWQDNPENIIGILHSRDLFKMLYEAKENLAQIDLSKIMTTPWFIPENTPLSEQLHAFRKRRLHFALVVDEYGTLQGIVTLEDILEEIVGQIEDEHDSTSETISDNGDGSITVNGYTTVRELNRARDLQLPDEEANTIAGLIMHETQKIPSTSDIFLLYGLQFEILEKSENQITKVKISPLAGA